MPRVSVSNSDASLSCLLSECNDDDDFMMMMIMMMIVVMMMAMVMMMMMMMKIMGGRMNVCGLLSCCKY